MAPAPRRDARGPRQDTALARARLGPSASDLVIVSRALADLAEYLQPRQESTGRGRVILDRRVGERRRAAERWSEDRRRSDRRRPPPSLEALMRVLGFMVVPTAARPSHRAGGAPLPATPAPGTRDAAVRAARTRARRPPSQPRPTARSCRSSRGPLPRGG